MGQAEQQALMAQLMGVLALLLYSLEAGVEAEVEPIFRPLQQLTILLRQSL